MDRDLVEGAQRGDHAAFVDLIRPRAPRLLAVARRITQDAELAEDALQDALVLAWRDIRGLRDLDRFDAWLQRIVVNLCIRHASRERRRLTPLRELAIDVPGGRDDLHQVALRDQLDHGFRHLAPAQRAALVLHHFVGYSPAEIAEALGIPQGTARSRLHNAHLAMRAALDADSRLAQARGGSE